MAHIPGVHIETAHNPMRYTRAQIERACRVAAVLQRGKLMLCEQPALEPFEDDNLA